MAGIILGPEDRARPQQNSEPLEGRKALSFLIYITILSLAFTVGYVTQLTLGNRSRVQLISGFETATDSFRNPAGNHLTIRHPFPIQHSSGGKKNSPGGVYPYYVYPVTQTELQSLRCSAQLCRDAAPVTAPTAPQPLAQAAIPLTRSKTNQMGE